MCYTTGKYTVCKRVRAFFRPEILQAGAVMGLKALSFSKKKNVTITDLSNQFLTQPPAEQFLL